MFGPGGMDFNEVLRNSRERMAKVSEARERMAGLIGRAESADGRITVASTAEDSLAELRIDPRAMRMGSEELAAAIREVARLARQDLDRQAKEITDEVYGDDQNPMDALRDPERMKKDLADMQEMFGKAGNDAQAMIDQLRKGLGIRHPGQPK
jgi:DNA-binding protein YbaB